MKEKTKFTKIILNVFFLNNKKQNLIVNIPSWIKKKTFKLKTLICDVMSNDVIGRTSYSSCPQLRYLLAIMSATYCTLENKFYCNYVTKNVIFSHYSFIFR